MFRCDAGADHGLGHLSRCAAIADAVAARGAATRFYVHADDALRSFAGAHEWHAMPWDTGLAGDLEHMQRELEHAPDSVVVVDNKRASQEYVLALRTLRAVAQIVDGDPNDSVADLVINNHPSADEFGKDRRFLLGPIYNTVRPGYFAAAEKTGREAILITMGGEDPVNHTAWLLRHVGDVFADRPVIVVIGPAHPDPESVKQAAKMLPRAEIHYAPRDLVAFVERSEIAISAGGTTCYELAAGGVAVAAIATEFHQYDLITPLMERRAIVPLGGPDLAVEVTRATIGNLIAQAALRERLREASRDLFPAPGAPRIADALLDLAKLH